MAASSEAHGWVLEAVDRFEQPLTRYARRLLGDVDLAADAVQHAFVMLCGESRARVEAHVAPWLFRVCRNRALDHLRRAGRERSLDDDEELRERWARIDRIVTDAVRRAQADGRVRPDLPALWVGDAWFWLVVAAWEGIEAGRIAPLDGSRLVLSTLLDGAAAP